MVSQALYRKWRSQNFEEVIGQEHVTLTLRNALREGRLSHAYLFTGPRGTGKTSTARILAKAINCLADDPTERPDNVCRICVAITEGHQLDLIEIDAASNRGIDEIRELRERIGFSPNEARYKVYIIDEVHMLTKEAFNALLKTLEEPPEHAVFVLATTEPERVPETVRSRCQRFDFRRIPTDEIVHHLEEVLKEEGRIAAPEALVAIARRSTGSMRDAISLLDQLLSYGDELLELTRVERVLGLVDAGVIGQLVDEMAKGEAAAGLSLLDEMIAGGVELGQLVDQIVAYLRGVLFARVTQTADALDFSEDTRAAMVRQARALDPAELLAAITAFLEARADLRDQVPGVPQLPIELAYLRSLPRRKAFALHEAAAPSAAQPAAAVAPSLEPVPGLPPQKSAPLPAERVKTTATLAASESKAAPVGATADLLERARANWDELLAQAGKGCGMKVQAALRSVRTLDLSGQTLVLQFSHAFSRDMVNQPEYRTQLESLWQAILGQQIYIRCVLKGETPDPSVSAAQEAASEGDDVDPLLRDALNLGAVVKPLQTKG